ncbi:transposase [Clostridium sp. FP2]|uniref:transposase n=1 Tax=Clostridium sp. FP2 TaxID=2724481 RepID=UPI002961EAFB|nr:transposase [Clostridium sp. FP2]
MYSILFNSVSETLLELSKEQKYLGAEIGFMSILHTWGKNLMKHPHMHCIVPSGGLTFDGNRWVNSKKDFFIPVKVLSRKFRGKFLSYLKKAYIVMILNIILELKN